MSTGNFGKKFGVTAINKGFITKEQFIEAMGAQIDDDLDGLTPRLIGSVLLSMGYMSIEQINEILTIVLEEDAGR
ncbi:hypothetical protein ACFLZT_02245 [Thermodesulfobacteriota bacterium]